MQAKRSTYRQIHEHRWFTRAICSKVDGVGGDDLVALVHEPEISCERTVDLLAVVDDDRSFPDMLLECLVDPLGGRLPVLTGDCQGLLVMSRSRR